MRKYDKEWLTALCKDSYSYAEVLRKAGRNPNGGGAQQTLRNKITEYNIDVSHFTGQLWHQSPNQQDKTIIHSREKYQLDDILVKNSSVTQKVLRGYIERYHIIDYHCQQCGCDGSWQGGIIALELDHINGDNKDNRIENLRYLCPNCHALTNTYCGKNKALKAKCREHTPTT